MTSPFFYCLDKETGKPRWIYKLGHRVEEATLCIYRDKVYLVAADGYVHAIEWLWSQMTSTQVRINGLFAVLTAILTIVLAWSTFGDGREYEGVKRR